jgi:hypothetical protein
MLRFLSRTVPVLLAAITLPAQESTGGSGASSYDGPNMMGIGENQVGRSGADPMPIRFAFNASGTYDTLLGAFRTDGQGNLVPGGGSYGVMGGFEVAGQKRYRRSVLGISYSGNYNHFPSTQGFSGFNQALNLGFSRRISRSLDMNWNAIGSSTNRLLGNPLNQPNLGAATPSTPVNELFDNRIQFLQSQMVLSYRISSRWRLTGGGNGGIVRRKATGLADVNLYGASSGVLYRLNRNSSIGVSYEFSHFNFGRAFGESNIHGVNLNLGQKIGRDWQMNASVGRQSVRTTGARLVQLDPVIAALLGTTSGNEAFDTTRQVTSYSFAVSRRYRRSFVEGRAERAVGPGNGLLLTSVNSTVSASASYSASRNWNLRFGAGYTDMSEVVNTQLGGFKSWFAQTGLTRTITTEISLFGSVEHRTFQLGGSTLDRNGNRFIMGISYSPSSIQLGR